jgi:hypothetical protein
MPDLKKIKTILYILKYGLITIQFLIFTSLFLIIFGAVTYKNENIIKNKKASIIMLVIGCIIFFTLFLGPLLLSLFT